MCYYDQIRFQCGDWKWANFREHCQKEYRMGETCGMKLVMCVYQTEGKCTLCERIERKVRRLNKHKADLARWLQEPHKFSATIEKTQVDVQNLTLEIQQLDREKREKNQGIGNPRRR